MQDEVRERIESAIPNARVQVEIEGNRASIAVSTRILLTRPGKKAAGGLCLSKT